MLIQIILRHIPVEMQKYKILADGQMFLQLVQVSQSHFNIHNVIIKPQNLVLDWYSSKIFGQINEK
jgi:hypothetical protein